MPYGFMEQHHTGHLLTVPLLSCLKQFFIAQDGYRQDAFDYQSIQIDSAVHWQGITAKQIVFCEGYHCSRNPWFSWLPLKPAKGEILTLSNRAELPDAILNYGNWLLPLESGTIRIGATFDREQIDNRPSLQGKDNLLNAIKAYSPSLAQSEVMGSPSRYSPLYDG